ncbi:MAG: hypothetical protein WAW96_06530 [Alphaproteobacteria bacterium]
MKEPGTDSQSLPPICCSAVCTAYESWASTEGKQFINLQSHGGITNRDKWIGDFRSYWKLRNTLNSAAKEAAVKWVFVTAIPKLRAAKSITIVAELVTEMADRKLSSKQGDAKSHSRQTSFISKLGVVINPTLFAPYDSFALDAINDLSAKKILAHDYEQFIERFNDLLGKYDAQLSKIVASDLRSFACARQAKQICSDWKTRFPSRAEAVVMKRRVLDKHLWRIGKAATLGGGIGAQL